MIKTGRLARVFAGLNHDFDAEDHDRIDMMLPYGQAKLIEEIVKVNPRTIVVMISGSPVSMDPWINQTSSVIQAWYNGMEGGNAIARVLFGDINPSGKLPVTFPQKLEDSPAHRIGEFPGDSTVTYKEGLLVGYRYYDSENIKPLFCFGHGLSYTNFFYNNLNIQQSFDAGKYKVEISFVVTNTGNREEAETAQIYLRDVDTTVFRPFKELKAFKKLFLMPKESETITIELDKSALAFYDPNYEEWITEPGVFEVLIGSSSKDIRLEGKLESIGVL